MALSFTFISMLSGTHNANLSQLNFITRGSIFSSTARRCEVGVSRVLAYSVIASKSQFPSLLSVGSVPLSSSKHGYSDFRPMFLGMERRWGGKALLESVCVFLAVRKSILEVSQLCSFYIAGENYVIVSFLNQSRMRPRDHHI